jgi:lanthanide-dependent methanol dehydrogenase
MYIFTPYSNLGYALDLTKDGAPVKSKYEPKTLNKPRCAPVASGK